MPAIFAIVGEANVLGQPIEIALALAVRLVARDGFRDFFERRKTVGLLAHEGADFLHAFRLDAVGDVDEHQRGGIDAILADRGQAGAAAHRRADQHRAAIAERLE